jgi:hypothetical protein
MPWWPRGLGVEVGEGGGGSNEWSFPSLTVLRDQTSLRILLVHTDEQ